MINNNLSKIISFITSKGFQIHPDALILMTQIQDNHFKVIEDILSNKKNNKESMVLKSEDIKNSTEFLSNNITKKANNSGLLISESLIKHKEEIEYKNNNIEEENLFSKKLNKFMNYKEKKEDGFKIIYDSNDKINSGEGVEGYTSLFKSRFEKSLKILSLRQDSKNIKKIEIAKQLFNQSKINYNSMSKEDMDSSLFVAGLVMNKDIKNNNYDLTIDDHTGLLTVQHTMMN